MSGIEIQKNIYAWADEQFNKGYEYNTGFTQLLSTEPQEVDIQIYKTLSRRLSLIHEFQDTCMKIFKKAIKENDEVLLSWLLNETPASLSLEYHKKLHERHFSKPVFFRTDEMNLGKIVEIQCPGSLWGELQFLYNLFCELGFDLSIEKPVENFASQLKKYVGTIPIVHYLTDNASIPAGVRYFIQQSRPYIRYFGIDREVTLKQCNFIRTHSFFGLCGENNFRERLFKEPPIKYDYPPNILFDQKATLVLPFWSKTKNYFRDEIRDIFAYSTPILSNMLEYEGGQISIEDFSRLPQSKRRYYIKYAGSDVSINWGSKAVERISKSGSSKCRETLQRCVEDSEKGKIWLLQKEYKGTGKVAFLNRNERVNRKRMNTKYSCFYGPFDIIGIVQSFRKHNKVHGQPDTVISLVNPKIKADNA